MVERNYFRMLSDEEASRYKFGFCKNCPFYECELVGEYEQFRENHAQDQDNAPLGIVTFADGSYAGKVVSIRSVEQEDNDSITHPELDDAHSRSFDADVVSYDRSRTEDHCIMKRSVYQVECGRKTVTEGIEDHYKIETDWEHKIAKNTEDRWEPSQPVFISAQTGQGKNYFIENTLIPYVRELNLKHQTAQKVLILSNRRALKAQIKNRLKGNDDSDEDKEIYSYNEYADVMTYQGLLLYEEKLKMKQQFAESRYIFVICDEAHFFTSDAMFNPHTQKILQTIVQVFKSAIRIYMSATPYECLKYIIETERRYYKPLKKYSSERMVFYHFKRDYSYLEVNYYTDISELFDKIICSISKNEKWLIFIDDKKKCNEEKENLKKYAVKKDISIFNEKKIAVIDANSKNDVIYQSIVLEEELDKDTFVLISTSVLDNGVNLTDVDNIVVSDMSKVKCLQMAGRARVKGNDDKKNLYIKRFSDDEVEKRIKGLMKQQDAYGSYERAYDNCEQQRDCYETYCFFEKYYNGSEDDWRNAKHWFGKPQNGPTRLYLNEIAKFLVDRQVLYYQSIYDEMTDEKSKEDKVQDSKCISHIGH